MPSRNRFVGHRGKLATATVQDLVTCLIPTVPPIRPMQSATSPELTSVVNYWPELPPLVMGGLRDRRIGTAPIYNLGELLKQIPENDFIPGTRDCKDDLAELQWEKRHILRALRAATDDCYRNSQWCQTSSSKWIPCDAYVVTNQKTGDRTPRQVDVYIKIGLSSQTGKVVLVVSCHEPEELP